MPSGTPLEAWGIAGLPVAEVASKHRIRSKIAANIYEGRSRDGLYEPALADSEREAVADLLQYLENVRVTTQHHDNFS